jgi:hypothetical protein
MQLTTTKPKPFCFVLMPFDKTFDDIYEFGIKGACSEANLYCERVDKQIFLGSVLDRIYSQISKADVIVADMTGRNPNVFYEVGYAHALGRKVVLLTQSADDIPFDLKHFPHIIYRKEITNLKSELARYLSHLVKNEKPAEEHKVLLDLYANETPLSNEIVVATHDWEETPNIVVTMFNAAQTTFYAGNFHVGLITSVDVHVRGVSRENKSTLPDGRKFSLLDDFGTLFPGSYVSLNLIFDVVSSRSDEDDPDDILRERERGIVFTIRVLTSAGYRDYALRLLPRSDIASSELTA